MGDIERVLRALDVDPGFAAHVCASPVPALDAFGLSVDELERVAGVLRPMATELAGDDQRRLLGGLAFLMARARSRPVADESHVAAEATRILGGHGSTKEFPDGPRPTGEPD